MKAAGARAVTTHHLGARAAYPGFAPLLRGGGQFENAAERHQFAVGVPPAGVAVRAAVHGDAGASKGETDLDETLVPTDRT